jgi:hypothetical protein
VGGTSKEIQRKELRGGMAFAKAIISCGPAGQGLNHFPQNGRSRETEH